MIEEQTQIVATAIATHRGAAGALLPILHAIQDQLGYVPPSATGVIADALNLSHAEVHGVISFYHDFRTAPPGRHVVKLCRAEACQAMGANHLVAHVERKTGILMGQTSEALTLEAAYCLGLCASGPAALVDGRPVGRLSVTRADAILAAFGEGA